MKIPLSRTFLVSVQANVSEANVKQRSCGRNQNGQPVEFGQPLFVIG
jgi:hypothetical protein